VVGGCLNVAGVAALLTGTCNATGDESILGGLQNMTSSAFASAGGPAGAAGVPGAVGAAGVTGPAGAAGVTGAAGTRGASGSRGASGKVELVTCTTVRHGKVSSKHCSTRLVTGPVSFKTG
jgi:hypothetical protein